MLKPQVTLKNYLNTSIGPLCLVSDTFSKITCYDDAWDEQMYMVRDIDVDGVCPLHIYFIFGA